MKLVVKPYNFEEVLASRRAISDQRLPEVKLAAETLFAGLREAGKNSRNEKKEFIE